MYYEDSIKISLDKSNDKYLFDHQGDNIRNNRVYNNQKVTKENQIESLNHKMIEEFTKNIEKILCINPETKTSNEGTDVEKYFRPSKDPIMNDRSLEGKLIFLEFYNKDYKDISLPKFYMKTPEDTIINYYSLLREAANPVEGKGAGCGSLGTGRVPYGAAYNFLTEDYKERLSFEDYKKSFENILHINLIKMKQIPVFNAPLDTLRFFIELETIEGSENENGTFAYYYGFIDIVKEGNQYKISNIDINGEKYLCAPYHSWYYDAEAVVEIKYGGWCNLVEKRCPTLQEGYVKKIYFTGTDGYDYLFIFFTLTNDNDIEIAQFRKKDDGSWVLINIRPEECIENKKE